MWSVHWVLAFGKDRCWEWARTHMLGCAGNRWGKGRPTRGHIPPFLRESVGIDQRRGGHSTRIHTHRLMHTLKDKRHWTGGPVKKNVFQKTYHVSEQTAVWKADKSVAPHRLTSSSFTRSVLRRTLSVILICISTVIWCFIVCALAEHKCITWLRCPVVIQLWKGNKCINKPKVESDYLVLNWYISHFEISIAENKNTNNWFTLKMSFQTPVEYKRRYFKLL